jgi:hypothetical protein
VNARDYTVTKAIETFSTGANRLHEIYAMSSNASAALLTQQGIQGMTMVGNAIQYDAGVLRSLYDGAASLAGNAAADAVDRANNFGTAISSAINTGVQVTGALAAAKINPQVFTVDFAAFGDTVSKWAQNRFALDLQERQVISQERQVENAKWEGPVNALAGNLPQLGLSTSSPAPLPPPTGTVEYTQAGGYEQW